eukprot:9704_1
MNKPLFSLIVILFCITNASVMVTPMYGLIMQAFYVIGTLYAINIILRSYFHTPTTNTFMVLILTALLFRVTLSTPALTFVNSSDPNAPHDAGWISAYYNGSIWLFKYNKIIEYNINNEIYYDRSILSTISFTPSDGGQTWAQVDNILYAVPRGSGESDAFNLATKQDLNDSTFTIGGCYRSVCAYGNLLLVVQGSTCAVCCMDHINVYTINQQIWTTITTRSTDGPRKGLSCQVVNNVLYVIGGGDNAIIYDTVMTMNVQGIGSWNTSIKNYAALNDKLSHPRPAVRSWVYGNLIYVISKGYTEVDVIDTSTGSISFDSHLRHAAIYPATIVVNGYVYIFEWNRLQKAILGPTVSPTNAPSISPTNAPSISPTNAPSTSPSGSPTACVDYVYTYNSTDGIDRIKQIINMYTYNYTVDSIYPNMSVDVYDTSFINIFDTIIKCNNTDANVCFVGCYVAGSCADTIIKPNIESELDVLEIVCYARKACKRFQVNIINNVTVDQVNILCMDKFSCELGTISINSTHQININIECVEQFSCVETSIDLFNENGDDMYINISCSKDYSCNQMVITTDNSPNIFITLNALRYSKDISIIHHFYKDVKVNCGVIQDNRYIRYDTNILLDTSEVLEFARNEYKSTHRLPCEYINIICSNNSYFHRECTYKYKLNTNFSLFDLLKDKNRPNCYWLDINHLYEPSCFGTCGDTL